VDKNGNFLLDNQNRKIMLEPNADINVASDGTIYQNDEVVTKIAIENFSDIDAVGDTYYRPKSAQIPSEFKLHQGYLEGSNVNALEEMTSMIVAQRRFEIYSNMIKNMDQLTQKTNEIGKV
jgi:flagellar basal body rod protein FlgG